MKMLRNRSKRYKKMLIREYCKEMSAGDLVIEDFDFVEVDFS